MSRLEENAINKGFSKISHYYEALDKTSSLIHWMRTRVRTHITKNLTAQSSILEINSGSGIDAVYFTKKGHTVHAIDLAVGMIDHVKSKIISEGLESRLSCEVLSFEELDKLSHKKYSYLFSNFGGLNCCSIKTLEKVFNSFHHILDPQAVITLVIMPKFCIWECLRLFKGNKNAFRRLKRNGVMANIGGEEVRVYYHSAKKIKAILEPNFTDFYIENIGFIGPTGNQVNFPEKHPILFNILNKLDNISNQIPFLKGYGDYYILSARKK
ncbi:ubiquinone/menaquinone biosynthesis C-methylase UbiE [Flavobacteriaceae bacterium MAR_2010_72]|nr:ubiquinone/menaquinone biosynthesis C-methylase UbiE [Flavobacteriaceae bacterium MAR_2010_72]TVZ59322.1 ubiquinone/menaquinone biosynthesis C-methylase UbiE [Flavobacteriaceae bacterium MAR_2010_105]